jgi:hypothetical protein
VRIARGEQVDADSSPPEWIDPRAPFEFVEETVKVRNALVESAYGDVTACCIEASGVLALRLRHLGHQAERIECRCGGWPHSCCVVGWWALDPTAEQFGWRGPTVSHILSAPVDWARDPDNPPLCEIELIYSLASWISKDAAGDLPDRIVGRSEAIAPLLRVAELDYLLPAVMRTASSANLEPEAPCFCGAPRVGVWKCGNSQVPMCSTHAAPLIAWQKEVR